MPVRNGVRERVREMIALELGKDVDEVQEHHTLLEDLGVDSLDLFEITVDVEDTFGVDVSDAEAEAWKTVADIVACVKAKGVADMDRPSRRVRG